MSTTLHRSTKLQPSLARHRGRTLTVRRPRAASVHPPCPDATPRSRSKPELGIHLVAAPTGEHVPRPSKSEVQVSAAKSGFYRIASNARIVVDLTLQVPAQRRARRLPRPVSGPGSSSRNRSIASAALPLANSSIPKVADAAASRPSPLVNAAHTRARPLPGSLFAEDPDSPESALQPPPAWREP